MVHGAGGDYPARRRTPVRIDLYRNVLHLHLVLGVQDLLRVRVYAARVSDSDHRDRVRDDRVHVLPAQRGGLPMAVDELHVSGVDGDLHLHLLVLLLLLQDKNVRPVPDVVLLWLHGALLGRAGHHLRHGRLHRDERFRAEDLFQRED
uniref:(northern house mosquito) hypothetical protein n=1 Tax=Culex pipiens TaxID=7175 RepID=A0A8D8ER34_CULPI